MERKRTSKKSKAEICPSLWATTSLPIVQHSSSRCLRADFISVRVLLTVRLNNLHTFETWRYNVCTARIQQNKLSKGDRARLYWCQRADCFNPIEKIFSSNKSSPWSNHPNPFPKQYYPPVLFSHSGLWKNIEKSVQLQSSDSVSKTACSRLWRWRRFLSSNDETVNLESGTCLIVWCWFVVPKTWAIRNRKKGSYPPWN